MSDEQVTLIASVPHLKYLSLPGCSITDAGSERIPQIEQLEVIHLFFAKRLTSAGVDRLLSRAKSLQDLALEGSQITDDMLSRIVPAKLSGVNLTHDSGMQHLSQMESLDELVIINTKVTEAGLKLIRERFPKIKIQH